MFKISQLGGFHSYVYLCSPFFFYESDGLSILFDFIKYLPGAILIASLKPVLIKKNIINEN